MKLIVFHSDHSRVAEISRRMESAGHQVVAATSRFEHLQHLMGEFGSTCVVAGFPPEETGAACPFAAGACAPSLYRGMIENGFQLRTLPQAWEAAVELCVPHQPFNDLVCSARAAFRRFAVTEPTGLSRLPGPWLAALPRILARLASAYRGGVIPCYFAGIAAKHGICELELHQETEIVPPGTRGNSRRLELRMAINRALYPSAWRPLKRRHIRELRARHPELHSYLASGGSDSA